MATRLLLALCALALVGACGDAPPPPEPSPDPTLSKLQEERAKAMGVPASFVNDLGMRFVFVPSGEFVRGSPPEEAGRKAEETLHEVRIRIGYYLQVEPVTQAQLAAWPGSGIQEADASLATPVRGVSHDTATCFAAWVSEQDATWDYRLPTEAEWERACRAGTTTPWSSGLGPPASSAGPYENPWGFRKMHVGIREWCLDVYAEYPSWTVVDPRGPNEGRAHVVRGNARSAQRDAADAPAPDLGFRLAIPLGCGLGKYGSTHVTFRLVVPGDREAPVADADTYDLRVIRMNDRLSARTRGIDPEWVRVERPGSPVTLTMVPGKYYVYAEVVHEGVVSRGVEIKFQAWDTPVEIPVPVPERDLERYGSGGHEKPQ